MPQFGSIVRDSQNDVGLVLSQERDRILALWEASGEVQSVWSFCIRDVLGTIEQDCLALVGDPESGFLGLTRAAYQRVRRWAPRFPQPHRRLNHSVVVALSRGGKALPPLPMPTFLAFDEASAKSELWSRVKNLTESLHTRMGHLLRRELQLGNLDAVDTAAQGILSFEGHRAYTRVKRDVVLAREDFNYLSEEQRLAVAATTLPTLVTARAGTGKTTTLVARACSLITDFGVPPAQILILAFNKKAQMEITERLERQFPGKPIPTTLTFHALAYQIVKPQGSPLMDDEGSGAERRLSKFIEDTIRAHWTPHLEACIQRILSEPSHEEWLQNGLMNTPDLEYLRYRLKLPHYTLRGEQVKSSGEKAIADFYARHGLDYHYEKGVKWDNRWYFPDFTLLHEGRTVIHEHWGISSRPGDTAVPWSWTKSHADYLADMERKREFWSCQGIPLLETSIGDLSGGKEHFEALLSKKLSDLGIPHQPLDDKELLRRIIPLQKNRIRAIFATFIGRMKSGGYTLDSIWEKIHACHPSADTEAFLNTCSMIYTNYQERLHREHLYDFHDLLDEAHQRLRLGGPSESIIKTQKYRVDLANLRHVMIDEFQDFNRQFSNLVEALKAMNPTLTVFCVGDDWQAINAFMGADTNHFFNFRNAIPATMDLSLTVTRRCPQFHVARSNDLMKTMGGVSARSDKEDPVEPIKIEKLPENLNLLARETAGVIRKYGREKSYVVLFRTNRFEGREIEDLYQQVAKEYVAQADCAWRVDGRAIRLMVSTVHGFKGKEADVVVIADASAHSYPLIHPDGIFYEAFGDTPRKVIEDERRLFYVAITRSKEHLRIYYDGQIGPSPFLEEARLISRQKAAEATPRLGSRRMLEVPF